MIYVCDVADMYRQIIMVFAIVYEKSMTVIWKRSEEKGENPDETEGGKREPIVM